MSRFPLHGAAGCLILTLGLAAFATGDPPVPKDQPAKDDGSGTKRLVYVVKHGTAKELAPVLAGGFKGVAEVQALPDPTSNCLLISASPGAFDDLVKVLEQLDRRPRMASIEILVAETGSKPAKGDKTSPAEDVDEKNLSGPAEDVEARLEALQKKGALSSLKRIRLTAVEGQLTSVMIGENKPFVAGIATTPRGLASRSITYRNTGIMAEATVCVSPDDVVTARLKVEDSHDYASEDGIPVGTDESGKPVTATEFALTKWSGTLEIPSGQAVAAEGVKTEAKSAKVHTLIIIGARVIEQNAKPEK